MGYLISLEDATPPARQDGRPWTSVLIEESEALDGEWAVIETVTIGDPDADPKHPKARNFSSSNAALAAGWYRLTLHDEVEGVYTMNPVRLVRRWAPTEADVAAYIWARTKVPGGKEVGTFNDETRVKGEQARRLIDEAVREVSSQLAAEPCTDDLRDDAKAAAAIYAAMLIEAAYWPEQTTAAGSSYANLERRWEQKIAALAADVKAKCAVGADEIPGAALPRGSFDDGIPLYGRDNPPSGDW